MKNRGESLNIYKIIFTAMIVLLVADISIVFYYNKLTYIILSMAMILLHDVEVMNQPTLGTTKPAFKIVVQSLGYEPTLRYVQQRQQFGLVVGQCVMGRHSGNGLDWGRCASLDTPMEIDISGFRVAAYIRASDGRLYGDEDKLSCYRGHRDFCKDGEFYDLMPKHEVMNPIVTAMKATDAQRTEKFVRESLKWT